MLGELSTTGLFLTSAVTYPVSAIVWVRACWGRQTHYIKAVVQRTTMQCVAGKMQYGCHLDFVPSPQTTRFLGAAAALIESFRRS